MRLREHPATEPPRPAPAFAPRVSVVICTYTERRLHNTYRAVESALRQSYLPHEVILVVDHNPLLYRRLERFLGDRVRVINFQHGERGAVSADNAGIEAATGDIVAFMDDDAHASRRWLERLVEHYQNADVAASGGRLVPLWDGGRPWWFPEELDWVVGCTHRGHPEHRCEIRNLVLCNMSVRRDVFQAAGGFAPGLGRRRNWGTGAEAEFFLRARERLPGSRVLFDPEAVVYHHVSPGRARLGYVILRSYNEGYHKALIQHRYAAGGDTLTTERSYLRSLVASVLGRLAGAYRPANLGRVAVILLSVAATGAGYLVARARLALLRPGNDTGNQE